VYAHYFHLLNKSEGYVYLLSSSWLKNMLNEVAESIRTAELSAQQSANTWRGDDLFSDAHGAMSASAATKKQSTSSNVTEGSTCLPLFEPPSPPTSNVQLQTLVVYYDAYLGHVALVLLSTGQLIAINVSVHTKLCSLHSHLAQMSERANSERDRSLALLPETLRKDLQEYHIPYRTAQVLLTKIEEGLQKIPALEVTVETEEEKRSGAPPSTADARKLLASVSAHIESAVLIPLKRLHENTLFHADVVRDMIQVQNELIHGAPNNASAASTAAGKKTCFPGIKQMLQAIEEKQKNLQTRVEQIHARDEALREELRAYYELTCNLPRPLTRAEKVYQRQLRQWLEKVRAMNEEVALLKMKTDSRRITHSSSVAGAGTGTGTGVGTGATSFASGASQPPPPPQQQQSVARGSAAFFKASSASFLSSTTNQPTSSTANSNSSIYRHNASLDVSSVSLLVTPWSASRPNLPSSSTEVLSSHAQHLPQTPMTPPPASSSAQSMSVVTPSPAVSFLSPSSRPLDSHHQQQQSLNQSQQSAGSGLFYYHPEAVRYPATASFTSPGASVGGTTFPGHVTAAAPAAASSVTTVHLPELSTQEAALVQESLDEIGQSLARARQQVESSLKDLKHHQRQLRIHQQGPSEMALHS
jgi:hypothetical protein